MNVVDAIAKTDDWPLAKRMAVLWFAFTPPVLLIGWAFGRLAFADAGVIDLRLWDMRFGTTGVACLVSGGIALLLLRMKWDARLWAMASTLIYAVTIVPVVYTWGFNSSAFALLEGPVLLAIFWYDDLKVGLFAAVANLAGLIGLGVATATGAVAYAPGVVNRDLDALGSAPAVLGFGAILVPVVMISFGLCLLVLARLKRARAQRDSALDLISKYMPEEVASGILAGSERPQDGYRRQKVTSFFSDIVGFTDLSEELEPEDLATVLNEYFAEMAEITRRHHGTLDALQGDGLVLIFGAPAYRSDREHALDAVQCAQEMQAAIPELNRRWSRAGIDARITVRIGINTGVVTVGHFGSGGRLKYSVLGKHVNLAARVQALCEPGKILISHSTWLLVQDDVETTSLGEHPFKGITRPVEVYELTAPT